MLQSINPFTGLLIEQYPIDKPETINEKIKRTHDAQALWSGSSIESRTELLQKLASYLRDNVTLMGKIATDEMGKPISQSIAEIEKCAYTLDYFAEDAHNVLAVEKVNSEASESFVSLEPLGTVLAIMPWNFPYWQVYRAMAPILISGNTMLLKHASNVTGCAKAIEESLKACGFPEGVFELLQIKASAVEAVIADKRVNAITFTGSTEAGRNVAATAGKYLKKQVLELGGSDAYVVLNDADLPLAAQTIAQSRLNNTGQSCIAAKRVIAEAPIAEKLEQLLLEAFEARPFNDPSLPTTTVGTMARTDLRDELHQQVEQSVKLGAKLICGGYIPEGQAAFYPPTILTNVKKGMPAFDEELFGPVASIIIAEDEEEAITLANDTEFGLGGAIFSENIEKAKHIATKRIQAGSVFVNAMVSSNPRLPFGGIKQSGYGRELSSFGVKEFCNIKTIFVK